MKASILLLLLVLPALHPALTPVKSAATRPGKDFALFFANNRYQHHTAWGNLATPVKDARSIAADLHDLYGFDTTVVVNATKNRIRQVLAEYAAKAYKADAQLLVYFTGHGQYLEFQKDGFFIPLEGKPSKDDIHGDSWLKYTELRRIISGINCNHILFCMDACFSGTLDENIVYSRMNETFDDFDRPNEAEYQRNQRIEDLLRPRTRLLIASGRKDYVPDPSEFARQFKTGLRSLGGADGLLDVLGLYHSFLKKASSQPIIRSFEQDEPGSSFIFDYRSRIASKTVTTPGPTDDDYDGEPDATDRCRGEYGTLRGCPDTDGDGVADIDDDCDFEVGPASNKGCPVRDSDNDGVVDAVDQCPDKPGRKEWQGCPDSDSDGIPDHRDDCPGEKGVPTLNGCPPKNPDAYSDAFAGSFVKIKGGTFDMGSEEKSDEKPVHRVTVSDFYLGRYEITVAQFKKFVDDTGYKTDAENGTGSYIWTGSEWKETAGINWRHDVEGKPRLASEYNHPVIHVSWNDAQAFCQWVSRKTGETYRLPTEAEWEYAAGNGTRHTKYSWGNGEPSGKKGGNVPDEAVKNKFSNWAIFSGYTDGYVFTAPVGSFDPNELGLYDMTGNVWEWCNDWYGSDYYDKSAAKDPQGPDTGSNRVIRGGSWVSYPQNCRVAFRYSFTPGYRYFDLGFRLARAVTL